MRELGDFSKIENLLQREGRGKQAGWGKIAKLEEFTPTGRRREASGLEQKWVKPEDYSRWKKEESKRVGVKMG